MKVTRRNLALTVAAAAMPAVAQQPASAADPVQAARDRLKAAADALAKEKIPMATEPAVTFHAE